MPRWPTGWAAFALGLVLGAAGAQAQLVPLDRLSHVHGLAVDGSASLRLVLATHDGLFLATPDGFASRISGLDADLMSFAAHPGDGARFFASGHPKGGGNLGVIATEDAGRTWRKISDGAGGPVDFHALAISPVNPEVMFGVFNGLQVSRDGGVSWQRVGPLPGQVFSIAASAKDIDTLYLATREGLLISRDGGRSWTLGYILKRPVTMVHVTPGGRAYAFVYGTGLVATDEPSLAWRTVSKEFDDRAVMSLAVDPKDPDRLYGVADTGAVMTSADGGRTWTGFEGSHMATAAAIEQGGRLFAANCQACHGVMATGEPPENITDPKTILAPALDDSMHGWHHPDRDLINTILEGSQVPGSRMAGWKDTMSRSDAQNVVAYIKSLWSFRSHACQGARHMGCLR